MMIFQRAAPKLAAADFPMNEAVPAGYRLAVGLTPCIMFAMTGIIGYGTTNVLPEVAKNANAVAFYGILALLIQVISAISSPLAGCLGDIWGRKTLIIGCLIPFTLSTVSIGLADNVFTLFTAILVMSLTFSICQTSTSAMIFDAVDGPLMSSLMGIRHSCGQLAFLLGPMAVGALTTLWGVRTAYAVMAPLGILSLILVAWFTPNVKYRRKSKKIDWKGALLLLIAMGGVSFVLSLGGKLFPWVSVPSFALTAVSVAGCLLFYQAEKRADNPVIDLRILAYKEMKPILWYKLLMQTSNGVFGAYLILYCQEIMGMDSIQTGLFGLARIAAIFGSSYVGVWIAKKKRIICAAHLATAMALVSGIILMFIYPQMPFWLLMLSHVLLALNTSYGTIPLTLIPTAVLPKELVGNGFGIFYFSENLGSVVGTAAAAFLVNLVGGGNVLHSFRYIALSFVLFTVLRFLITVKKFPQLNTAIQKI